MFSLLIVDDQKKIREGLRVMIQKMNLPFRTIETAVNGEDALKVIRQGDVNLVVADIRMPIMDGLTLMKTCREEGLDSQFLVISGYDDFSYAQKAIEYGASAYLLKPVSPEELQTRLEQCIQNLEDKDRLERSKETYAIQAAENRRKALQLYMHNGQSEEQIPTSITENPLWSDYRLYRLVPNRTNVVENGHPNQENYLPTQYIWDALEALYPAGNYFRIESSPHLIVAVSGKIEPQHLVHKLHQTTIFATACVTGLENSLETLPERFRETEQLFHYAFLFPEKEFLMAEHVADLNRNWSLPWEKIRELFHLIGYEETYPITETLSELFQKETLRRNSITYFESLAAAIVNQLEEYERVILPWVGKDRLDLASLRNPYGFAGVRSYLEELQKQILHLNNHYFERQFSYENNEHLRDAITYIQQNYYKSIDLAAVAEHVHLNYAYLSSVFKKNIGKSFSEYLRDVRIDAAKHLLAETEDKISDIAGRVGFDSYRSFVRSFQEVVGLQASEYREFNKHT